MMLRIRMRGVTVGQVDDVLVEEYRKIRPFKRLVDIADVIISEEILHYKLQSSEDILLAEKYVQNLRYRNIGEFITDYMRSSCMDYFQICRNCEKQCRDMKNEYQIACDRFSEDLMMPAI